MEYDNAPICSDSFFWKIIDDFCWSYIDTLSWEDFYTHINHKISSFQYSQNVMNMLYEFITKKADFLYSQLFLRRKRDLDTTTSKVPSPLEADPIIIKSICEEIVSRGIHCYDAATTSLVYYMYEHNMYTLPGGLCSIFTSLNNTESVKIMKCVHIPTPTDFLYVSSEEENLYV
jgi:hypothetical protein